MNLRTKCEALLSDSSVPFCMEIYPIVSVGNAMLSSLKTKFMVSIEGKEKLRCHCLQLEKLRDDEHQDLIFILCLKFLNRIRSILVTIKVAEG